MSKSPNTINESITACEIIIRKNERKSVLIQTLIVLAISMFLIKLIIPNAIHTANSNTLAKYTDSINKQQKSLQLILDKNTYYASILKDIHFNYHTKIKDDSTKARDIDKILSILDSAYTIKNEEKEIITSIDNLTKTLPSKISPDDKTLNYIFYGAFVLIFGILTSFYRYYMKEISKYEHYLIGFHRIRVAGNNSETGYEDEVKKSLTQDAFTYDTATTIKRTGKVESPIPGHPTSDIGSHLVNKILDAIEITATPKTKS